MNIEKLLTIEQVAKLTNVSIRYIHNEKKRGNLKCYKIGNRLKFDPVEVEKWIKRKVA
jgi:excisionase family DNA binding protein